VRLTTSRLRLAQLLTGVGALVLLVLLFTVKWYGSGPFSPTAVTGWQALIHLRWLMLLTILSAFALVLIVAFTRSPLLRAALSTTVTVLSLATLLWLGYRVFISIPPGEKPAAYVGVACAAAILLGGCLSLYETWLSTDDAADNDPTGDQSPHIAPEH
jgi:hypothetical protein